MPKVTARGQAELVDICTLIAELGQEACCGLGRGQGRYRRETFLIWTALLRGCRLMARFFVIYNAEEISQESFVTALGLGVDKLQEKPFS